MQRIAIIGDFDPNNKTHIATNNSLDYSAKDLNAHIRYFWIDTNEINLYFDEIVKTYQAFIIAPGSPYNDMTAVLRVIEYARNNKIPLIGTCGGFQHMVIEFARNVLEITDAMHAEYDPYASKLVINPLSCSLVGQTLEIEITDKESKVFAAYGTNTSVEKYHCNFGLNPTYQRQIHDAGFKVVATDKLNEARILELNDHPFFIATLFLPQDNSSLGNPHPLMNAFLKATLLLKAKSSQSVF